jgi:hypothetical protein
MVDLASHAGDGHVDNNGKEENLERMSHSWGQKTTEILLAYVEVLVQRKATATDLQPLRNWRDLAAKEIRPKQKYALLIS